MNETEKLLDAHGIQTMNPDGTHRPREVVMNDIKDCLDKVKI